MLARRLGWLFLTLALAVASLIPHASASAGGSLAAPAGLVLGRGPNDSGQAGPPPSSSREEPAPVGGLGGVVAVSAGFAHSLALLEDGTVRAWGDGLFGALGGPTTAAPGVPAAVPGLTDIRAIAAGGSFSLALRRDGTVYSWGRNDVGQLGRATGDLCRVEASAFACGTRPTRVEGLGEVVAIAAGGGHALALLADGSVWAWGLGHLGQLGDLPPDSCVSASSGYQCARTPQRVAKLASVAAISAGKGHSLAVLTDGRVWAWGDGSSGQIGENAPDTCTAQRRPCAATPVMVAGLTGAAGIAAGGVHSVVLLRDGRVRAFGYTTELGIGIAAPAPHPSPVAVPNLAGIVAIAAGFRHSLALGGDGAAWAWGAESAGSFGDGPGPTNGCSFPRCEQTPTRVRADGLIAISAGAYHSLAIRVGAGASLPGLPATGGGSSRQGSPPALSLALVLGVAILARRRACAQSRRLSLPAPAPGRR